MGCNDGTLTGSKYGSGCSYKSEMEYPGDAGSGSIAAKMFNAPPKNYTVKFPQSSSDFTHPLNLSSSSPYSSEAEQELLANWFAQPANRGVQLGTKLHKHSGLGSNCGGSCCADEDPHPVAGSYRWDYAEGLYIAFWNLTSMVGSGGTQQGSHGGTLYHLAPNLPGGIHYFNNYEEMLNWLDGDGTTLTKSSRPLPGGNAGSSLSSWYTGAGSQTLGGMSQPTTNNIQIIDKDTTLPGGINEDWTCLGNPDQLLTSPCDGQSTIATVPLDSVVTQMGGPNNGQTTTYDDVNNLPLIGIQKPGLFNRLKELGGYGFKAGIDLQRCFCSLPSSSPPVFQNNPWECCDGACVEYNPEGGVRCSDGPLYVDKATCDATLTGLDPGECYPGDPVPPCEDGGTPIEHVLAEDEVCVTFTKELNTSIQKGDKLYYSLPAVAQSGINHPIYPTRTKPVLLGVITDVVYWDIAAERSLVCVAKPLAGTIYDIDTCDEVYYFFSKDNEANLTSLVGYYAEVEIRNNSLTEAEMFSITTDFSESSR